MDAAHALGPADEGWVPYADETFLGHVGSLFTRRTETGEELGLQSVPHHRNLSGLVHGGVLMTLLDRVMAMHVIATRPQENFVTATMNVEFLRVARIGEFIRLRAVPVKSGRRSVFMRAEAWVDARQVGMASALFVATG